MGHSLERLVPRQMLAPMQSLLISSHLILRPILPNDQQAVWVYLSLPCWFNTSSPDYKTRSFVRLAYSPSFPALRVLRSDTNACPPFKPCESIQPLQTLLPLYRKPDSMSLDQLGWARISISTRPVSTPMLFARWADKCSLEPTPVKSLMFRDLHFRYSDLSWGLGPRACRCDRMA